MSKLQKKFLKYFLLLGIVPVAVISIIAVLTINFLHQRDLRLIERNLLNQKSVEISKFFESIVSQFQIIVSYENYAPPKINEQEFLLKRIIELNPNVKTTSFVCSVAKKCQLGKETIKITKNKQIVIAQPSLLQNRLDDPAFINASQGKIYLSKVNFEKNSASMIIAAPVRNKNNQIIGVLIADINLTQIEEIIANSTLGKTGYIYLVDTEGKIIANSLGRIDFTPANPKNVLMDSKIIPATGWNLVAEWPEQETYEIISDIIQKTIFLIVVVMVFVFLFSYLVAVGVLNPMKKLIEGAEIVGQGNLDYKVNIKSNDEVQNLAEQFNKMTDGLKKIESLTRALAKEKELSVIKSQFLTTVSHQLNTPVTEINWALQSIDFEDKENIKLAISSIKTGSQNISDIISDVLTLSDIGFDYKPKNIEKIKLNEIIDAVLQKYAASIQEKNIKIDFNPNAVFEIQAEKNTISKLFEELIENAIIYNNQNGTIDIYLSRTDADKDEKIIVSIKDTGIGIPFDDRQFIFKEIFRAKNAPSGKNVGTGMGLLIARIITEGHNGKIWFSGRGGSALGGESKEGEGTTFYLQLPA